jgi:hypothetical protein
LQSLNTSVSYIYKQTWSLTGGWMAVSGTADAALYGTPTGGPNSAGWIAELAYLPFMHGGPKFWPWLNFRIGLQYSHWNKFNGASTNIDGMGAAPRTTIRCSSTSGPRSDPGAAAPGQSPGGGGRAPASAARSASSLV